MNIISKIKTIGNFYRKAKSYNNLEDRELAELVYKILEDKEHSCSFNHIENVRKSLLKDNKILNITDLGAGSGYSKKNKRTVKSIANTALSPKWQCEIMANIIKEFHCNTILELGTSLGISASYLANANRHGTVYTLEGSEAIASVAMRTFASLRVKNVKLVLGNFDITLPTLLNNIDKVDLAFIDGNHRYESTIKYFEMILENSHSKTIFILDDINWSKGMQNAWNDIVNHPEINGTLDLHNFGIAFTDNKYNGNHTIIKSKYKIF